MISKTIVINQEVNCKIIISAFLLGRPKIATFDQYSISRRILNPLEMGA